MPKSTVSSARTTPSKRAHSGAKTTPARALAQDAALHPAGVNEDTDVTLNEADSHGINGSRGEEDERASGAEGEQRDDGDEGENQDDGEASDAEDDASHGDHEDDDEEEDDRDNDIDSTGPDADTPAAKRARREAAAAAPMSADELKAYNAAQARRGVIYLSRVPPFMRPVKLRHLLSPYGAVDRIYLRPEDGKVRGERVQRGGNKKRNYAEGWIEFEDKRVARRVAESLNATPIGGRKGNFFHDDLWCLKYLPKFKWHHLTERVAYDRAVREKRLQAEMAQVQRESNLYVEQATKAQRCVCEGG